MLLKIIAIYLPDEFLDIYAKDILSEIAKILGVESKIDSAIELNYCIVKKLREIPICNKLTNVELTLFLYEKIAEKNRQPVYWSLGHNYGGDDMLPQFIEKSRIGIGYFNEDLLEVIGSANDLKEYLVSRQEDNNTIRSLKDFCSLREGDIVYLKTSYTRGTNGKTTVYRVDAVAKVLEDVKSEYEFDEEIKHSIKVEFLSTTPVEVEGINYLRTISKISNKEVLDKINNTLRGEVSSSTIAEETILYNEVENFDLNEDTKNFILYGPPGTGKTYNVVNKALQLIDEEFYNEIADDREKVLNRYKQLVDAGQIEFCTFHERDTKRDI